MSPPPIARCGDRACRVTSSSSSSDRRGFNRSFSFSNTAVVSDDLTDLCIASTEVGAQRDGFELCAFEPRAVRSDPVLRQKVRRGLEVLARVKAIDDAHSHARKVRRAYAPEPEIHAMALGNEPGRNIGGFDDIARRSAERMITVDTDRQRRNAAFNADDSREDLA
ncbi:hypothetical protein [Ensifer canadensis]